MSSLPRRLLTVECIVWCSTCSKYKNTHTGPLWCTVSPNTFVVEITVLEHQKYILLDYDLISADIVRGGEKSRTPALYPSRISGLILERRYTHSHTDGWTGKIRKIRTMNTFVPRNIQYDLSVVEIMAWCIGVLRIETNLINLYGQIFPPRPPLL